MSDRPALITANDLADGSVLYLRPEAEGPRWVRDAREAGIAGDAATRAAWLALAEAEAAANRVVAPYAVEVEVRPEGLVHASVRERIRAEGPTAGLSLLARPRA
jgi:hypothetical protein